MIELELDRTWLLKVAGPGGHLNHEVYEWLMSNCGPKLRKDHSGNYITSNSFKGWNYVMVPRADQVRTNKTFTGARFILQFVYPRHAILFKMKWA